MDKDGISDWLKLGVEITDINKEFNLDGRTIIQKSIEDLKEYMPIDSAIKVSKAVSIASKRDLRYFEANHAKVVKIDELQPIENYYDKESLIIQEPLESIHSILGNDFGGELGKIRKELSGEVIKIPWIQKMITEYKMTKGDVLIYLTFLRSINIRELARKVFMPFIFRTPSSFFKCKNYMLRLLSVLRKLPNVDEGTYSISTKYKVKYFSVGKTFAFPSFALGVKSDKSNQKGKFGTTLKIRGWTSGIHKLEGDEKERFVFEPDVTFKVTKIERDGEHYMVYGDFIKQDKLVLDNVVEEFRRKIKELKGKLRFGNGYAERFPLPLEKILTLKENYKVLSLYESVEKMDHIDSKACFKANNKVINNFQCIEGTTNLKRSDTYAIFIYTLELRKYSPYRVINSALANRKSENSLLKAREFIFYLLMALRKLPRSTAKVLYRGVRMNKSEFRSIYYVGRTIVWTPFTSTTIDKDTPYKFAGVKGNDDNCGVIFEIHGNYRGYSIASLSGFGKENEVLLEPDAKFIVTMIYPDDKEGILRVVLYAKETKPVLEYDVEKFQSYCEELEETGKARVLDGSDRGSFRNISFQLPQQTLQHNGFNKLHLPINSDILPPDNNTPPPFGGFPLPLYPTPPLAGYGFPPQGNDTLPSFLGFPQQPSYPPHPPQGNDLPQNKYIPSQFDPPWDDHKHSGNFNQQFTSPVVGNGPSLQIKSFNKEGFNQLPPHYPPPQQQIREDLSKALPLVDSSSNEEGLKEPPTVAGGHKHFGDFSQQSTSPPVDPLSSEGGLKEPSQYFPPKLQIREDLSKAPPPVDPLSSEEGLKEPLTPPRVPKRFYGFPNQQCQQYFPPQQQSEGGFPQQPPPPPMNNDFPPPGNNVPPHFGGFPQQPPPPMNNGFPPLGNLSQMRGGTPPSEPQSMRGGFSQPPLPPLQVSTKGKSDHRPLPVNEHQTKGDISSPVNQSPPQVNSKRASLLSENPKQKHKKLFSLFRFH